MTHLKVFSAPWCAPCKNLKPLVEQLEFEGLVVVHVDIDEDIAIAAMHGVRSVPTLKFYQEDELLRTHIGGMSAAQLKLFTTP